MTAISAYFLAYLPANIWVLFLLFLVFVSGLLLFFQLRKTQIIIYLLLIWLPLESLVLRWTPVEYYGYIKYCPEVLLYGVFLIAWWRYWRRTGRILPALPLNKWLLGFLAVAIISLIANWYSPAVWLLGLRQLLRFVLLIFLVFFVAYPPEVRKKFFICGAIVLGGEIFLAFIQYLSGGALDPYLFSTQAVNIGNRAWLGGIEQFWTPGTRVFATLGRYDQLGSFLMLGLLFLFPVWYFAKEHKYKLWIGVLFLSGLLALFLTMSRASWLAFFVGIVVIGIGWLKEKKLAIAIGILAAILSVYLVGFAVARENALSITERSNQNLAERIFESVSLRAWRESYNGYGRIFFIINTPSVVVWSSPLWGVGPGNYGGGVAAALLNTKVYERLRLPFGIQNVYGQIDNSWFCLWGEYGTLGLVLWGGILVTIFCKARKSFQKGADEHKWLAAGVAGATVGIAVLGFFGPYFEFRTLMFYYWLAVGLFFSLRSYE